MGAEQHKETLRLLPFAFKSDAIISAMQIFVKTFRPDAGGTWTLEVQPDDTAEVVECRITEEEW
jgi:hypothetical protein